MISIVVPVYKCEKTLNRCVESLLVQTYPDLEIILVDDGSRDKCPEICDSFAEKDPRIKVIHKENGGVSTARNAGLLAAEGAYVAFVDSDDYVDCTYCEDLLNAMEHSDSQIAICGYHHHYVGNCVDKPVDQGMDLLSLYGAGFINMPWNKLFVRELLMRAPGILFPEKLDLGEDLLFNLEYLKRCTKIALVGEQLYHYIQEESGNTLSSKKRENKLELAKLIRSETQIFFGQWSNGDQCGDTKEVLARIRRVVDTRFLCECLDDVERLPFEKDWTYGRKAALIREFCRDTEVQDACRWAAPGPLDYRILGWCLSRGLVHSTYGLSLLRSLLVRIKRKF